MCGGGLWVKGGGGTSSRSCTAERAVVRAMYCWSCEVLGIDTSNGNGQQQHSLATWTDVEEELEVPSSTQIIWIQIDLVKSAGNRTGTLNSDVPVPLLWLYPPDKSCRETLSRSRLVMPDRRASRPTLGQRRLDLLSSHDIAYVWRIHTYRDRQDVK